MNNLKKLIFTGNLGNDPRVVKTDTSTFVSLSVASSTTYTKDGKKTSKTVWLDFTANGKLVDIISKYFHKGTRVAIEAEPYNTKRKIGKGKAAKEYTFVAFKIINILNISDSVNSPEEE